MKEDAALIPTFIELSEYQGMYKHPLTHEYVYAEEIRYHKDWSLLMPVVQKIEDLFDCDRFDIGQNEVYVWAETPKEQKCRIGFTYGRLHNPDFETKIEAVYNAVVTFIKWYNQNKICE